MIFIFRNSSWETTGRSPQSNGNVLSNSVNPSSSFTSAIAVLTVSDDNLHEVPEHQRGAKQIGTNKSSGMSVPDGTLGDLTQIFPTFSNLILNLSFYRNADPKSTYMSNIQPKSAELWTNL